MIGTTLRDRYVINSELGRGGMGIVYQATDTVLQREVAIKVVVAAGLGTEGRGRLLHEAQAAAGLNHPNIVAVHDVDETPIGESGDIQGFIVMELVDGQSLHGYRPATNRELADLAQQMCRALHLAHEKGIIHRDLKPENVLLTKDGLVKLMDFGLARLSGATRLTQEGAVIGTLSYLAPEVIQGQPSSKLSDLYALGVMLYELAAGRPPFQGDTPMAVLSQHLHAPVVPPSAYNETLSPAIENIIVQLLEKEPKKRPPSAEAVRQALVSWREESETPSPASLLPETHVSRLVRGRLVGRDAEYKQGIDSWQAARAGSGRVLLISGEPGIGKTRLMRELTTYAEADGGLALVGECYEEGGLPYGPFSQIVRTAAESQIELNLPAPNIADLVALAPKAAEHLSSGNGQTGPNQELNQNRLYESVVALAESLAERMPLLLVVDDVHWADSGSVGLFRHLARQIRRMPVLLMGTYREIELDEALPFRDVLSDLNRERLAERIKLGRLDREHTERLLSTLFDEEITPDFLDGIYRETEGNPFFVEEVSRALIDSGDLYYENGRWHRPSMEELDIPQGVRVAIQSRLSRLDKSDQSILQTAALLGREFRYDMLVEVAQVEEDELISALERAEAAQLIEELKHTGRAGRSVSQLTFSYTHALIYSALVESLSTLRRQRLQRHIALTLEEAYPEETEELAPMLGRFFAEAGEGEKAVHYLLQAGDAAQSLFAFGEAARAFEQALIFLREKVDQEPAARTLMKLGLIYHSNFEFERSREAYEEAFTLLNALSAGSSLTDQVPASRPVRFVANSSYITLDPTRAGDSMSMFMLWQLFEGLVEMTQDGEITPALARRWEIEDGGARYIFHLRDDIHWSDGQPITAHDVVFAWRRALKPGTEDYPANQLYDVKGAQAFHEGRLADPEDLGIKAITERILAVELEEPVGYFLLLLEKPVTYPIPRHIVEEFGEEWAEPEHLVGSGAFTIESREPDGSVGFKRNPYYSGWAKGNVTTAKILVSPSKRHLAMYEGGETESIFLASLTTDEVQYVVQKYPDEQSSIPYANTVIAQINLRKHPFDDLRVRQALAMATDKPALVRKLGLNRFPATGGFVSPGMPGHLDGVSLAYDPRQAQRLLAAAGYPGGREFPTITILTWSATSIVVTAEETARQWRNVLGIPVEVEEVSFEETLARKKEGRFQIALTSWAADHNDPDSFLRASNFRQEAGWNEEEYDRLVDRARLTFDREQRLADYMAAEEIIAQEVPIIPLTYAWFGFMVKPWLKNYPTSANGHWLFKHMILEERDE